MARPNRRPRGWKSWFGSFFTAPRAAGRPRRLRLESLESRWVRSSFTVTDNSDSAADVNSLRYAIDNLAAGTAASANTITIDSVLTGGQTITLGGLLDINEGVTITGPGASSVAISGGNTVGVFKVETGIDASIAGLAISNGVADAGGGVDNLGTVSIDNCTLSGDSATLDFGGALYNSHGSASITNSTISGNSSTLGGGGIHNAYGSLSIANCTLSGNTSARCGGAIYDLAGTMSIANSTLTGNVTNNSTYLGGGGLYNRYASVSVDNCTISGNSATTDGGAIENYDGTLSIANSTVSGNSATTDGGGLHNSGSTTIANSSISGNSASKGGGIFNSDSGTLSIDNSTVSGDSASSWGGGIYDIGGTLSVANSTLTGNSAPSSGGALYNRYGSVSIANSTISGNSTSHRGGGLYNGYGTLSIANSTISGNSAGLNGGGIYNEATATLKNSIVSGNRAPANPDVSDVTGGLTDQGNNLLGTALDAGSPPASDVFSDTPGLAALGNYGGGSETMALLPGSPALGAGSALGGDIATTDERGVNRPATGPIDIGAYQSQGFTLTPAGGASPQTALVGSGFAHALALTVTANGLGGAVDGGVITFTSTPGLNGQSATLSGARATISGGEASVTATANNQAGAYTVSASPGNTGSPVSFDLTNQIQSSVVLPVAVQPSLYSNNTSDAVTSYVDSLYRAILGRLPGVTDDEYWVGVLDSLGGVTATAARQDVAIWIWNAPEHRQDEVAAYYQTLLGRSPSAPDSAYWVHELEAGVGELSVVQDIMSSPEYQNKTTGNNTLFVQNLLGALGGTGTTTVTINGSSIDLVALLDRGALTRSQAVSDAVLSDQSLEAAIGSMYQAYLQRPVEANGSAYRLEMMRTYGVEEVGVGLLSSPEYFQKIEANL